MRAQFEENIVLALEKPADRRGELHRLADVAPPVTRVEWLAVHAPAGHCRPHRDAERARREAVERRQQVIPYRLHLRAMEGVLDFEESAECSARRQCFCD